MFYIYITNIIHFYVSAKFFINYMKSLLEELDRIKSLMVYEKGKPLNEVSTKVVKTTDSTSQSAAPKTKSGNEETKPSTETTKSEGENCLLIKASGEFVVNINKGSKAVSNFINNLEKAIKNNSSFDRSKVKDGSMYITEITLQGFASNYNKGAIEPDFDNDWCKKWDTRGGLYDGLCTEWEIKPFSGKKKSSYSGDKTANQKLASDRAINAYNALKEKLTEKAKEEGIKIDPNLKPNFKQGGTIFTNDNVDENWKTRISQGKTNPGQVVLCTAKVCYSLNEEKEEEECPDKCMEKDANGKCVCPESKGLKEVNGKCVCIKDNKPPDENCECKEKTKECPTCQELNEKTNKCECQKGLKPEKDDEGKIKCVCPNEGEELIKSGKKCECKKQPKPPECNQTYEIKGGRGTKPYNFVTKAFQRKWPFEGTGEVTISFNPLVVPDAFYVKYGEQEFWSGFVGDIYKKGDGLYKMISVPKNIKNRFYKDIYPNRLTNQGNTNQVDRYPRIFAAELVWYKENDGLLESINAEISKVGGNPVNSIFKNGDGNAETITKKLKNVKKGLFGVWDTYGNVLKGETTFTLKKESGEEENIMIIVFSPLAETLFNMKIECK